MKKILFVIESLSIGGAEKSLVTLLNSLDYNKYDVDLQLFSYGGEFEKLLPKQVNVLPILPFFDYCNIPYGKCLKKLSNLRFLLSQLAYSMNLRMRNYNNIQKSVIMWRNVNKSFNKFTKEYDVAIAYAQGVPTFYVAEKIKANKKIAWINVSYFPEGKYKEYITKYYVNSYDKINCVSESVKEQVITHFNLSKNKLTVIKDIISYEINDTLSTMDSINFSNDVKYNLLTVGRIVHQKGYDIAIEACKLLHDKGLSFKWYVVGDGIEVEKIKCMIAKYNLEDIFILLGAKSNPYPYFKACDIYVQCSRFEGFGIVLAEARQFNKPIVTTNFDSVKNQITNNINGLITDIDSISVAKGIEKMMRDDEYRNMIIANVEKEEKDNLEEVYKFDNLVQNLVGN